MTNATFQFAFSDLKLKISGIENFMGYKEGEDSYLVTDLIEEILKESGEISNIKAQYSIFPVARFENVTKSVVINNTSFEIKKIVFGQIKKSESVAIFLCTAGPEIGIRSKKAMYERDLLRGYIYDVIGT